MLQANPAGNYFTVYFMHLIYMSYIYMVYSSVQQLLSGICSLTVDIPILILVGPDPRDQLGASLLLTL